MSEHITWQKPPKDVTGRGRYDHAAAELRSNPGRWALVIKATKSAASLTAVKKGQYAAFRPVGHFEAVSRGRIGDDGKPVFDVYIRYIGDAS